MVWRERLNTHTHTHSNRHIHIDPCELYTQFAYIRIYDLLRNCIQYICQFQVSVWNTILLVLTYIMNLQNIYILHTYSISIFNCFLDVYIYIYTYPIMRSFSKKTYCNIQIICRCRFTRLKNPFTRQGVIYKEDI